MNYEQLDLYHRAFQAFKRAGGRDGKQNKLHKAICQSPLSKERLSAVHFACEVKTDWIEAIENHLIYIEKAIAENRQFILQQGETQLIEKARRISKTSVEHLAHHSELITHLPKPGEDLLPDKIYVPENDSNFAVYENRFLYMLLLDLADFVDRKYMAIMAAWNQYDAELILEKEVSLGKRELLFALSFKEKESGDMGGEEDDEVRRCLKRIGEIQRNVMQLMQSPLMRDVSRAPLVKPPITRTNVLKMDPNFKMTVELYDYLCAYEEDGYTVREIREEMDGFSAEAEDDFSELVAQTSYLTQRYGKRLTAALDARLEADDLRLREEEDQRKKAELALIRQKMKDGECSGEEYIHALEERNGELEAGRTELFAAEAKAGEYRKELLSETERSNGLAEQLKEARRTLDERTEEMHRRERQYQAELEGQKQRYEAAIAELQARYDELYELQLSTMAQLRGIRSQYGLMTEEDDCCSKEMLIQLEKEQAAFKRFFDARWKKAKKQIRKKTFGKRTAQKEQIESGEQGGAEE